MTCCTPLGDARYLLSPGDLYALQQMPEIVQLGVRALKIEGRYKDADYVALTTQAYRQAVDEAWAGRPSPSPRAEELRLEQVYSRGLGAHFVSGTNHQTVVTGRAPRHRGVLMGRVIEVRGGRRGHPAGHAGRGHARSSRATAWSSTPRTGAAPRSRKRAGGLRDVAARRAAGWSCALATAPSILAASARAICSGAPTTRMWTSRPSR